MPKKEKLKNENLERRADRLWEWILHEDNLFLSRGNFFLVAESMLFAGFATLVVTESVRQIFIFVFGIVGILCSVVWIYLAWAQINLTMNPIKSKLREFFPDYARVTKRRGKFPSTNFVLGVLFPFALLIAWIILLVTVSTI